MRRTATKFHLPPRGIAAINLAALSGAYIAGWSPQRRLGCPFHFNQLVAPFPLRPSPNARLCSSHACRNSGLSILNYILASLAGRIILILATRAPAETNIMLYLPFPLLLLCWPSSFAWAQSSVSSSSGSLGSTSVSASSSGSTSLSSSLGASASGTPTSSAQLPSLSGASSCGKKPHTTWYASGITCFFNSIELPRYLHLSSGL